MSRKREVSTDVSQDARIADLSIFGHNAVAMYLMAIPQADDWGRLPGNPREFKMLVCPGFDETTAQIQAVLEKIAELGLWDRYEVDGKQYIAFPPQTWFKRQSYINSDKRVADTGSRFPANQQYIAYAEALRDGSSKKQQETAENSVSLSPSPSLSISPSISPSEERVEAQAPALTGENHATHGTSNSNVQKIRRKFEPPAAKTVGDFFRANGSTGAEARFYFDHYTGNGWMVGRNPMRDWQATARNWIRRSGNGKPVIPDEVVEDEAELSAREAQERADAEREREAKLLAEQEERRRRAKAAVVPPPPLAESEKPCLLPSM